VRAAVIRRFGGPEVFEVETVPEPGAGLRESLVDVTMSGVNFGDLRHRTGDLDPGLSLPAVLGVEAVGVRRRDGRRVAALLRRGGGYAEVAAAPDTHTVLVPDGVDDLQAAALLEQGCTAYGALTAAGRFHAGERVAVTAAAGGVGHLAVQIARAGGAGRLVGTGSTAAKREFVRSLGADVVLDPSLSDLSGALRDAACGGVDLVVDTVGGPLLRAALGALAPFGRVVSVGARSSEPDVLSVVEDLGVPSIGVFGFWMRHVVDDRARYGRVAGAVFDLALRGELVAAIDRVVALTGIGAAHAAIAARETIGKVLVDVRRPE
jgi:NADPH2:quinone reductase